MSLFQFLELSGIVVTTIMMISDGVMMLLLSQEASSRSKELKKKISSLKVDFYQFSLAFVDYICPTSQQISAQIQIRWKSRKRRRL